jgi:uncharacterized protein
MTTNPITRRRFMIRTAAGLSTLALSRGAHTQEKTQGGPYIDIHTHITQEWGSNEKLSAKALIEWMDANNVAQACVLPLIMPESWDHPVTTDYVLRETEPYRDRLIPFCSIDPRTTNLNTYEKKVGLLKLYKERGCRGFGEYKPGIAMDDPRSMELFAACGEAGLPVLFHLDTVRNWDEPGLPGLIGVLEKNPDTNFIGHAQGWWASISGGLTKETMQRYPEGTVQPGGALDHLLSTYPNIYGDLSAGSGANAIGRDKEFGRQFLIRHADRLLFGSDYLKPQQDIPQFELLESLDLPKKVQRKIYGKNAAKLLGLDG